MIHLEDWGYDPAHQDAFASVSASGTVPARIIEEQRDGYRVMTSFGEGRAVMAGRLRHEALDRAALPAVGDWVVLRLPPDSEHGIVQEVLPRRTALLRKEAGATTTAQVVASNVDDVLLLSSLNSDLDPRRIERYLAAIWESGAQPCIVLTKADLCPDPEAAIDALADVALGVDVIVVSAQEGQGLEAFERFLTPGTTIALVGSSGVGKSTLVNALAGEDVQRVDVIRARDERGQHTTTARRMMQLPSGALWVDTPGMREFGLWEADEGLGEVFDDIEALATICRFRDCGHDTEPGCALHEAVESGDLDPGRIDAWQKLQRELAYIARKQNQRAHLAQKQQQKRFGRMVRSITKEAKRRKGLER